MIYILAGFGLLLLLRFLARAFMEAKPGELARLFRRLGQFALYGLALLLLMRGQLDFALALGTLGLFLGGGQSQAQGGSANTFGAVLAAFLARRAPHLASFLQAVFGVRQSHPDGQGASFGHNPFANPFSRHSSIRTRFFEMVQDPATRRITGRVLQGQFANRPLEDLSREEALALYLDCLRLDPAGAALLEFYLNSRFAGWRQAREHDGNTGGAHARGRTQSFMRREEALKILGLKPGASRADIIAAHRALMKKVHPDHGGTSELAAKVNEAKSVLLS